MERKEGWQKAKGLKIDTDLNEQKRSESCPRKKSMEKRLYTIKYESGRKSPTFSSTLCSPLSSPSMNEPDSPSQKPGFKIELDFRRLSPAKGHLREIIKKLAQRKEMTAKAFAKRA